MPQALKTGKSQEGRPRAVLEIALNSSTLSTSVNNCLRAPQNPLRVHSGEACSYLLGLSRIQGRPLCIYSKLHRNQVPTTKQLTLSNSWLSPSCHTHFHRAEVWPSRCCLRSQSHRRGPTPGTVLSCPIHNDPSASDGQYQIDGNHTLSFRTFMHTSNLNFQVHITISKSDIQCSQTVHL